jgi:hypothetical protein
MALRDGWAGKGGRKVSETIRQPYPELQESGVFGDILSSVQSGLDPLNQPAGTSDLLASGVTQMGEALKGRDVSEDPYLAKMYDLRSKKVRDAVMKEAQFGGYETNPRLGGILGDVLGGIHSGIYAPAAAQEREFQQQAMANLPGWLGQTAGIPFAAPIAAGRALEPFAQYTTDSDWEAHTPWLNAFNTAMSLLDILPFKTNGESEAIGLPAGP